MGWSLLSGLVLSVWSDLCWSDLCWSDPRSDLWSDPRSDLWSDPRFDLLSGLWSAGWSYLRVGVAARWTSASLNAPPPQLNAHLVGGGGSTNTHSDTVSDAALWSTHLCHTRVMAHTPVPYQGYGPHPCIIPGLWSTHLYNTRVMVHTPV